MTPPCVHRLAARGRCWVCWVLRDMNRSWSSNPSSKAWSSRSMLHEPVHKGTAARAACAEPSRAHASHRRHLHPLHWAPDGPWGQMNSGLLNLNVCKYQPQLYQKAPKILKPDWGTSSCFIRKKDTNEREVALGQIGCDCADLSVTFPVSGNAAAASFCKFSPFLALHISKMY